MKKQYLYLSLFALVCTILAFAIHYNWLESTHPLQQRVTYLEEQLSKLEYDYDLLLQEVNQINQTFKVFELVSEVTAYTKECGYPWDDGITAFGNVAKPFYTIATDPKVIPTGSLVVIEGYPYVFEAQDIGGAVVGSDIDVYVGEGKEAKILAMRIGRTDKLVKVFTIIKGV